MTCPDPITLSTLFDEGLPDDVRAHAESCTRCGALLAGFAAVRGAMQAARPRDRAGDLAGVLARTARRRPLLRFVAVPVVVILVIAFLVLRRPANEEGVLARYDGGGRAVIYVGAR